MARLRKQGIGCRVPSRIAPPRWMALPAVIRLHIRKPAEILVELHNGVVIAGGGGSGREREVKSMWLW